MMAAIELGRPVAASAPRWVGPHAAGRRTHAESISANDTARCVQYRRVHSRGPHV